MTKKEKEIKAIEAAAIARFLADKEAVKAEIEKIRQQVQNIE